MKTLIAWYIRKYCVLKVCGLGGDLFDVFIVDHNYKELMQIRLKGLACLGVKDEDTLYRLIDGGTLARYLDFGSPSARMVKNALDKGYFNI